MTVWPTSAGTLLLAVLLVSAPAARASAVQGRASQAQPCQITAGSHLSLAFSYGAGLPGCGDYADNNGNIREQEIEALVAGQPAFSQTYDYDNVNRLLSVSEDLTSWSRVYSYDAYGNRAITGVGAGAAVGIQQPQALADFEPANNRLKTAWADYDAAGNLDHFKYPGNAAFDWTAAYDAQNKQRWFCKNDSTDCGFANADAEYRYDGQGNRVQKILDPAGASPTTITYVYDANGRLAAEYSTAPPTGEGGTFYRTTDHLGSTRLVTRADGSCKVWQDFYPFGERILGNASTGRESWTCYGGAGTDPFEQEFTAKERDDESGLDYFGARYFSASLGRFTSADAPFADQHEPEPQSWNLFAYGRNNPLLFVDPTGRAIDVSGCTDVSQCVDAVGAATGSAEAAKQVDVKTVTEERGFWGKLVGLAPVTRQVVTITGDVDQFRGFSENASRLADLVESEETVRYEITSMGFPENIDFSFIGGGAGIALRPGGATSRVPSQNFFPVAFVHPGGASYLGDPTSDALGIPPANRAERTAHELLGHVWAEVVRGIPGMVNKAPNPANAREAVRAEQNVRNIGVGRGIKTRH